MNIEKPFENIIEHIINAGIRPTRQRIALAKLLFRGDYRHVTADGLYKEALRENIRISIATIYNTLHQFTAANLLQKIVVDSDRTYFDTNVGHHHHFFYSDLGQLEDIQNGKIELLKLPELPHGTKVDSVDVLIKISKKTI
jgi:Fur family iron response transcriptional regulator